MHIGYFWLQLWLQNHCKNTAFYFMFQLSLLLLLNNYQYNCNNTISSVSVVTYGNRAFWAASVKLWNSIPVLGCVTL